METGRAHTGTLCLVWLLATTEKIALELLRPCSSNASDAQLAECSEEILYTCEHRYKHGKQGAHRHALLGLAAGDHREDGLGAAHALLLKRLWRKLVVQLAACCLRGFHQSAFHIVQNAGQLRVCDRVRLHS